MTRTAAEVRRFSVDLVWQGRPLGWRNAASRLATAPLRGLPDFLVIGAMKAGTTSLYSYLRHHPRVLQAVRKEVHYFDQSPGHFRSALWYRAHFPLRAKLRRRGAITGEATPLYLYRPWVPPRVRAALASPRLIVILRDSVARAISHYGHLRRRRGEVRPLVHYLDFSPQQDEGYVMDREDPCGWGYAPPENDIIARSVYDVQLARWFEVFGREAVKVVFLEELATTPDQVVNEVFAHLGLESIAISTAYHRNEGETLDIADEHRERLSARFASANTRLEELLGRRLPW